jgi:hypothetical protein
MRNVILPNRELRLLANQLQGFKAGYTVEQIRLLDRVMRIMEFNLKEFNDALKIELAKEYKKPEEKDEALNKFMEDMGVKEATCSFEDGDFNFIKAVWGKMTGMSGNPEARAAILIIDNAIQNASEPVFTNGEKKEDNDTQLN